MRIEKLSKCYKNITAVDTVSLSFERKTYGLMGPNGAGKTTLLRCMAGLCKPTSGFIYDITPKKVGYLPQHYGAIGNYTVMEMMEFYSLYRLSAIDKTSLQHYLSLVGLSTNETQRVSQLSGGMLRRLGIAQALIGAPELLLFDEPTVGLDPKERYQFKELLKELQGTCTIILSTHILTDLENVCDENILLRDGKVLYQGTSDALIADATNLSGKNYGSLETAYLWMVDNL